jgi:ABC-type lipoprotein export system ATPase subunit
MMHPSLLLADEPTGNLDQRAGQLVFELLQDLCRRHGLTSILVTHNTALADAMDRCLVLEDGLLRS